jgi:FKBP-type peptidyl-prolyl cis-trans isomerase SlyD
MKIGKDSFVTIDYLIRLGEEETFPPDGRPEEISFCMGWGVMPPGLEEALVGLQKADRKVVHLTPEEAYGEIDPELVMEVPREDFGPDTEVRPGLVFETEDEDGHLVHFVVKEVTGETVVIDLNHPLAGRELDIAFTVKGVRKATPEDMEECACQECQTGEGSSHHH